MCMFGFDSDCDECRMCDEMMNRDKTEEDSDEK